MSIKYRIDDENQVVFVWMEGEISPLEVMSYLTSINSEQRDGTYDRLIMARETKCLLSGNEVASIAEFARKLNGTQAPHRTAIVASSTCEFGIARQYSLYRNCSFDTFNIFREVEEATSWLGLENVRFESPLESVPSASEPVFDGIRAVG
jgi:hypothetical protein